MKNIVEKYTDERQVPKFVEIAKHVEFHVLKTCNYRILNIKQSFIEENNCFFLFYFNLLTFIN